MAHKCSSLGLRKVTWNLLLELGEIPRDCCDVEAPEDRLLRLPVEQELEGRLETTLRRMLARGQPFACVSRHGDLVTSLTLSFADDHLENERILLGSPANLDHVDLLRMHVPALAGGCSVGRDAER